MIFKDYGRLDLSDLYFDSLPVYRRYYCSWEGPYEMHSLSPHQMHFTVVSDSNLHKWLWHLPALLLKFELNWTIQKFPTVYYYHYVTYVKYAWVHSVTVNLLYVMSFFLKLSSCIVLVPSGKIFATISPVYRIKRLSDFFTNNLKYIHKEIPKPTDDLSIRTSTDHTLFLCI